jgi:2-polyprenyl-3-methyl-5-hydroxy-6-metoxy-1,4-benzoquinol methylase
MPIDPLSDAKVLDSWHRNAAPWTAAVRGEQIESRRLVTDAAIVDAVTSLGPKTVLDLGCGEGWLVRALAARGIDATGVDGVPELVERARDLGAGRYAVATYEEIAAGHLAMQADVVVANFALIGHQAVDDLVARVPALLVPGGTFVVQTLHPVSASGDTPYRDGWRVGSWSGFSDDFTDPAPWYFRTLATWVALFDRSGLRVRGMREPLHPATHRPASVIFLCSESG